MADQLLTAAVLVPWVEKGGVYVIEDVYAPEELAEAVGGEIYRWDRCPADTIVLVRR